MTVPLAIFAVICYCYNLEFQIADDLTADLVFPNKMVTGTLGLEPFSERRLFTSLGGLYFLQTLVLTGADPHWLHAIDPALAIVVLIGLLESVLRQGDVALPRRLLVYLVLLGFLPVPHNLTAALLPVPLFLYMWLTAAATSWPERRTVWQRSVCVAVTAAALVALKTVYIIPVGIFLLGDYARKTVFGQRKAAGAVEALTTDALIVSLLSAWMAGSAAQTGKALYPLLGTGFITARFDPAFKPIWKLTPLSDRLELFWYQGIFDIHVMLMMVLYLVYIMLSRDRRRLDPLSPGL